MIKKRFATAVTMCLLFIVSVMAQMKDPVHFTTEQKKVSDNEIEIRFKGVIDNGWHVYSTGMPADGPTSAEVTIDKASGAELMGKLKAEGNEIAHHDEMFGMNVRYFEKAVTFVQKVKITGTTYAIQGYLTYGACNDENCIPPTTVDFSYKGEGVKNADAKKEDAASKKEDAASKKEDAAATNNETVKAEDATTDANAVADTLVAAENSVSETSAVSTSDLWKPVTSELKAWGENTENTMSKGLLSIFVMGFLGGLLALVTPCVWPIIPMTVSFFLKRNKDKKKGVKDACIYGVSIVVIYLVLGMAVTLILGANALNALSTNAIFNIFFCLMLVVFAASFFGWFEITLPESWNNSVNNKAESTSGILSIFLMAFTLTLVSFSCTGPIIGFLLVEVSTSGAILAPTIGMLGFALALALPFTLFAMFPAWLNQMPKSGNWMNNVKVCLGFLELAFSLKFFSVADMAYGWRILDREVFLCIWIVLFALLGAYLMGWFRFPHDEDEYDEMGEVVNNPRTPVLKFFMAMASFAFALYMVPGLWGAPCKAISAFAPPMDTQDFSLYDKEIKSEYNDYEQGMAAARQLGKPVMLDFTGYGCVNCRKMEGAVWSNPTVGDIIKNDYVLITLYVDDKTPLPENITIEEQGQTRILRTQGDKWSYLQRSKFGANAQPYYVLLNNEGKPLNSSYSYDEDVEKYLNFLRTGLANYKK